MQNTTQGKKGFEAVNTHKNSHFLAQMQIVFAEFKRQPQTMKEVEVRTGIDRANICWYVRDWRNAGMIAKFKRTHCPITRFPAYKLTTDPKLFPNPIPSLFPDMEGQEL